MRIRPADERDAIALAELHLLTVLDAFAPIFPPDAPEPELADLIVDWSARIGPLRPAEQACFVVEEPDQPLGVVIAGPDPDVPTRGHVSRLYVRPSHWRRGVGTALYERAIAHLREQRFDRATLWVLEGNARARAWYEQLGWRPNGERKTTYAPAGIDDLGYELVLANRPGR